MTGPTPRALRAGVIAAGRGDRLRAGTPALKPLVEVGGRALIDRVLTSIAEAGARDVVVIVNEDSLAVRDHVAGRAWPFAIRWIVETTPSSMHSFLRVVETLAERGDEGPFLVSTVDTVAPPGAFARFAAERVRARGGRHAGAHRAGRRREAAARQPRGIARDGDRRAPTGRDATAGYYLVRASILREADEARADGVGALRVFLGRLLARGYRIDGVPVPESVDVDRPGDVAAAEHFLRRVGS